VNAHESVMIEKYNAVVSLWRRVRVFSFFFFFFFALQGLIFDIYLGLSYVQRIKIW
jgi:hypothetical protein